MSLIQAIPQKVLQEIANRLGTSVVITLKNLDKIVTGKTARSIRTEIKRTKTSAEINVYAGGGMKYIISGKPAGTKLPVVKKGGKFELVQDLKDWKNIRNFGGTDFQLARAIAENKRDGIDIAGKTLELYEDMYAEKINSRILTITASDIAKELKKF